MLSGFIRVGAFGEKIARVVANFSRKNAFGDFRGNTFVAVCCCSLAQKYLIL